jgi:arabinose-5-phosphate isomerase
MRPISEVPCVAPSTSVAEAMRRMNLPGGTRSWGAVLVADADAMLRGIFTQGDFARAVVADRGILDRAIEQVMTRKPKVVRSTGLLADAYRILEEHRYDELPVVDDAGRVVGLLDVQDVLEWNVAL